MGISPEELIGRYHVEHQQDFAAFHIDFDYFYSTNSPENQRHSELHIQPAQRSRPDRDAPGRAVLLRDGRPVPSRPVHSRHLPEPACGAKDQYGDVCEVCGTTYTPTDLADAQVLDLLDTSRCCASRFITSSVWTPTSSSSEGGWQPPADCSPRSAASSKTGSPEGLRDWDISRDGPYFGFKIPGEENKYFYVWLDAPIGYIATTEKFCESPAATSRPTGIDSGCARSYHFIGKDIVYFHTLFWPAMLHGAGYSLPTRVHVHGFLTVNGEKMSKSRGTFHQRPARTWIISIRSTFATTTRPN